MAKVDLLGGTWRIAERYAANEGEYPWRFGVSGLAARLLMEQQAATLRWATWGEWIVAGWEAPSSADATWGVEALLASDQPLSLDEDPVRRIMPSVDRPGSARTPGRRGEEHAV